MPSETQKPAEPPVTSKPADPKPQAAAAPASAADLAEPDDGRASFVVTPRAGPKVAGQRVRDQQHIRLTEEEAASELLTGAIVRRGDKLHPQLLANAKPREPKADGTKTENVT